MRAAVWLVSMTLVCALAGGACVACSGKTRKTTGPAAGTTVTLFALGELRGQIEPCGCTTDPLGDLARTAQLVADARAKGPVVVVDSGSLLYPRATVDPVVRAQEDLKADLLARVYKDELQVAAVGLGPNDLSIGPAGVRLARQAANVPAAAGVPLAAPAVIDAGGERIGVFGVVDPAQVPSLGATDPIAAATAAVAQLKQDGATRVVGVATMDKKAATALARKVAGIDVLVVGLGALAPLPEKVRASAEQVGTTWMVYPTDRGQIVSRFELTLRPGAGPLLDAIGPAAAEDRRRELGERIATLDNVIASAADDPSADAVFVAERKRERDALAAERDALATEPRRVPAAGSYFELAQVRIAKALACDVEVVAAKQAYTRASGAANVAAAKAMPPPPPPPVDRPSFVGTEACADCHDDAVLFWKNTRHARAWETLEKVDKQFDYDCIGCHVTGWGQPDVLGATMARNESLRDVQCETCHGPGSFHLEAEEEKLKSTIVRVPADDLCGTTCHTPEHSDTFDRTAYLRDILGPGHGAAAREALGDGPTGHQLRQAGLAKAASSIGAGCPK